MLGKIELTFIAFVLAALLSLGLVAGPRDGHVPAHDDGFTSSGLAWNN